MIRAAIERIEGDRDGLRFGQLRLQPQNRVLAFSYDRLSGGVVLYHAARPEFPARSLAITPDHLAAARAALHAALPPIEIAPLKRRVPRRRRETA